MPVFSSHVTRTISPLIKFWQCSVSSVSDRLFAIWPSSFACLQENRGQLQSRLSSQVGGSTNNLKSFCSARSEWRISTPVVKERARGTWIELDLPFSEKCAVDLILFKSRLCSRGRLYGWWRQIMAASVEQEITSEERRKLMLSERGLSVLYCRYEWSLIDGFDVLICNLTCIIYR